MINTLNIENAKLMFRNFAGKADQFNSQGRRTFCIMLDDDVAEQLSRDGWNIKYTKPRDPEDNPQAFLQVRVNYNSPVPPKIFMVTSTGKTLLDEFTVSQLDHSEIVNVDIQISPYQWEMRGETGITAYVKTMYVTIVEDPFASKYDFND